MELQWQCASLSVTVSYQSVLNMCTWFLWCLCSCEGLHPVCVWMQDLWIHSGAPAWHVTVCLSEQGEKGSSALLCCGFSVQGKTNFSRVSSFLCKGGKCNHLSSKFTDVDRLFIHLLSAWIHFRKDETASWEDANRYWKQGKSGQTSLFWSALVYCYKCCFNQNLLLCVQFCGPGVTGKQSFVN